MKKLMSISEVQQFIHKGEGICVLSGSFDALSQLPRGKWIGGTSSYFIDNEGGKKSNDHIFVEILPDVYDDYKMVVYKEDEIKSLASNYYRHGFSYLLLPAFSTIHYSYAEKCRGFDNLNDQILMGWVAGFDLDDPNAKNGFVFNGLSGEHYNNCAIVLHVELKNKYKAQLDTINLFEQGNGDVLTFMNTGFIQKDCFIRGVKINFYDYIVENECDIQLPLVTVIDDLQTNISIKFLDNLKKEVHLYAPVFNDQDYQFASPIGYYEDEFEEKVLEKNLQPSISCNCILNYLYAHLEGKKTSNITCPMTFG